MGMREKVKRIMLAASERKMAFVGKVSLIQCETANSAIIQVLDFVGPRVRELVLLAPARSIPQDPKDYDLLDVRMIGANILFPALTHIRIDEGAVHFVDFVVLLIARLPNLISLDVDVGNIISCRWWEEHDDILPVFPRHLPSTKLERMRLVFGATVNDYEDHDAIIAIIQCSHHIQELALIYPDENGSTWPRLIAAVSELEKLLDLEISAHLMTFHCTQARNPKPRGFVSLKRLALNSYESIQRSYMDIVSPLTARRHELSLTLDNSRIFQDYPPSALYMSPPVVVQTPGNRQGNRHTLHSIQLRRLRV